MQQLGCHVFSCGWWETLREKQQVLSHTNLEVSGDAFSFQVPRLEVDEFFHVYYSQAGNGDDFLLEVQQVELHGPCHV